MLSAHRAMIIRKTNVPKTIKTINRISTGLAKAWTLAEPSVNHATTPRMLNKPTAIQNFRSTARFGSSNIPKTSTYWCTGKDSNLRSPKGRQIYSLLPLTTRPPVPIFQPLPRIKSGPVLAHPKEFRSNPVVRNDASRDLPRRTESTQPGLITRRRTAQKSAFSGRLRAAIEWSWRRDLNPRPSDYKSDALPTELRQPNSLKSVT